MTIEQWNPIVGYEDLYEVSSLGNVKRLPGTPRCRDGRILKPTVMKKRRGYLCVGLWRDNVSELKRVHRLVYEAFVGVLGELDVNHKDGNKRNNTLANLEAVTDLENKRHAMQFDLVARGERKKHVLTEKDVLQILDRRSDGLSYGEIGKEFGVSSFVIRDVLTGRTWRHTTGLPRYIPAGKKVTAILEADNGDYDLHSEQLGDVAEVEF